MNLRRLNWRKNRSERIKQKIGIKNRTSRIENTKSELKIAKKKKNHMGKRKRKKRLGFMKKVFLKQRTNYKQTNKQIMSWK